VFDILEYKVLPGPELQALVVLRATKAKRVRLE
jgi:hypothetical protein